MDKLSLQTSVTDAIWRSTNLAAIVRPAFLWWWVGLTDLFPGLGRLVSKREKSVLLLVERDRTTLVRPHNEVQDHGTPPEELHFPSVFGGRSSQAMEALRPLCAEATTQVALGLQEVFLLRMSFPKSAQARLRDAVAFKLITESPLEKAAIYFDVRSKKDHDSGTLDVEVALCRRETVLQALKNLDQVGISVEAVGFRPSSAGILDFVFYTSPGREAARSRFKRRLMLVLSLALVATLLIPATYLSALWLEHKVRRDIEATQKTVNASAPLLAQRALLQSVKNDLSRQAPAYRITHVLNEVAGALPKTAWITSLRYDHGVVHIAGHASNPPEMMRELGKLSKIGNAKLISVAGNNGTETPPQFEVALELKRPLP